jgi:hypothetical protein
MDSPNSKELSESQDRGMIALRHLQFEREPEARRAIGDEALGALKNDERPLGGDESSEHVTYQVDRHREIVDRGATGNRTPDLLHAMQALYQLSYSPEWSADLTIAPAALVICADRTHVRSIGAWGRATGSGAG